MKYLHISNSPIELGFNIENIKDTSNLNTLIEMMDKIDYFIKNDLVIDKVEFQEMSIFLIKKVVGMVACNKNDVIQHFLDNFEIKISSKTP